MKDCFDVAQDIMSLINIPEVKNKIDGSIYRLYRPKGSKKTDIVIGVISCDNLYIQTALVNVRIYTPGIISDGSMVPNLAKFDELSKLLLPLLDTQYRSSFWTEVEEGTGTIRQPDGSYFLLMRVTYRSIQENFKNI